MKKLIVLLVLGIFVLGGLAYAVAPNNMQPNTMQRLIKVKFYYEKGSYSSGSDSASGSYTYRLEADKTFYILNSQFKIIAKVITDSMGCATFLSFCAPSSIRGADGYGPHNMGEIPVLCWLVESISNGTININTANKKHFLGNYIAMERAKKIDAEVDNWQAQIIDSFDASDVSGGDSVDAEDASSSGWSPTIPNRYGNIKVRPRLPR